MSISEAPSPRDFAPGRISHGIPVFAGDGLSPEPIEHARLVPAGAELVFEGEPADPATIVIDGWIALSKMMADGRRQIVDIVLPMDVVRPLAGDGATASCTVRALTDAILAPCDGIADSRTAPDLPRDPYASLEAASRARQAERMLRIGQGTACERVAYALIELYVRLEALRRTSDSRLRLPITQQDLGEFIGLSSVHVCRTLHRLARDGVIEQEGRNILLRDADRLAAVAGIGLDRFRADILPRLG